MNDDDNDKTRPSQGGAHDSTVASTDRKPLAPSAENQGAGQPRNPSDTATRAMSQEEKDGGITVNSVLDGRFEIISVLGKGGMGTVFLGKHLSLERMVAIKVMHKAALADDQQLQRFINEGKALALLRHPKISACYFIGVWDGQPYMVMEHLQGKSLWKVMRESQPMDIARSIDIVLQIADALSYAHEKGIVHRDLKPSNIMLIEDELAPRMAEHGEDETGKVDIYADHVKVLDFGIAKFVQDESAPSLQKITQSGQLVGTFNYMSPEQCNAKPVDRRSDIFSLGVMFYELLAGKLPFKGESPLDTLNRISSDSVPPIERQLPAGLYGVVLKCLQKSPDKRYQNLNEFMADLQLVRKDQTDALGKLLAVEKSAKRKLVKNSSFLWLGFMICIALAVATGLVLSEKQRREAANTIVLNTAPDFLIDEEKRKDLQRLTHLATSAYSHEEYERAFRTANQAIGMLERYKFDALIEQDLRVFDLMYWVRANIYFRRLNAEKDPDSSPEARLAADSYNAVRMASDYAKAAAIIERKQSMRVGSILLNNKKATNKFENKNTEANEEDNRVLLTAYNNIEQTARTGFPGQFVIVENLFWKLSEVARVYYGADSLELANVEQRLSENLWEQTRYSNDQKLKLTINQKQLKLKTDELRIRRLHKQKDMTCAELLMRIIDFYMEENKYALADEYLPELFTYLGKDKDIDEAIGAWCYYKKDKKSSNPDCERIWQNNLDIVYSKRPSLKERTKYW